MRLTSRLLLGALAIIGVNVVVMAAIVNSQLGGRLQDQAADELTRAARVVAAHWNGGANPIALARQDGTAFRHRVTIIRSDGTVIGDTDFDREALPQLENHSGRPEVIAAMTGAVGVAIRKSPSRGDDELYVAVPAGSGVVRVSMPLAELTERVAAANRAVVLAGLVALIVALIVAWALARRLVHPLVELSEVARSIATGDTTRRAPIDAPGELGDLSLSLGDLSAQLAARDSARNAYESLLVQLIESLNEGVIGIDERRTVVRVNDTARQLLGVTEPVPFSTDLLPRDRALRDALESAFTGGVTEGVETLLGEHTLAISARPLPGGGAVLALLDLTRLRRLEAVRRDFVANVSHELRTPLTVIGGFAETLTHADLPAEERRQFADRIVSNTKRMQRLVDDLLDLSRIESGGWIPTPGDVDLSALALDAFAESADAASAQGVALTTAIDDDASRVTVDATAMRQILRNLVENAVRHTARGAIVVAAHRLPEQRVVIVVRDTGSGIAPEHLTRIFERFYRVDPARSRQDGGTGLGLAIVKHLVEAHGGTIRAESRAGEGTSITMQFPAA